MSDFEQIIDEITETTNKEAEGASIRGAAGLH